MIESQLEAALVDEQKKVTDLHTAVVEVPGPNLPAPAATEEVNVDKDQLGAELMNVLRETETTGPGAKSPDANPIRFVDMNG